MTITIKNKDGISIVSLSGTIMHADIATIRNRLEDLMNNNKYKIVMNLQNVSYLSSMLLAVFIDIKNSASKKKGDLKLAGANDLIKNLFEMTKLVKKIELYDTIEDACKAY
ncbi:MAG: STAS domain-containing protein [Chitinispirillaceae bacterium]|nr:STAS domain-containing protein [Chitinispirillaceae bacterium]